MVPPNKVRALEDPKKCRVVIRPDGTLMTYDGQHLLDTTSGGNESDDSTDVAIEEGTTRYLIVFEAGQPVLYASQLHKGEGRLDLYPTLTSHAQIGGNIVGAGDMTIKAGRVIALTNKSGTWLPRGPHLVATLRWLVLVNIISADAVYNGTVKVEQFIKNESDDGQNPDDGDLYRILGEALRGKLI